MKPSNGGRGVASGSGLVEVVLMLPSPGEDPGILKAVMT